MLWLDQSVGSWMAKMLEFPSVNGRVEVARNEKNELVGVTISLLVLTNDIGQLPEPFRESARAVLYAQAVKEN